MLIYYQLCHTIATILIRSLEKAKDFIEEIEGITENKIIHTIQGAEPIGPKSLTDIMVVAPCSGNTLAKLANSIIDTPSTMAIKSHLRNQRPLVVGISTNDGLSGSARKHRQVIK